MKKEINDFIEEITSKFSELYIETFFLRFQKEFGKNELNKALIEANKILNVKIKRKIKSKLKK